MCLTRACALRDSRRFQPGPPAVDGYDADSTTYLVTGGVVGVAPGWRVDGAGDRRREPPDGPAQEDHDEVLLVRGREGQHSHQQDDAPDDEGPDRIGPVGERATRPAADPVEMPRAVEDVTQATTQPRPMSTMLST